MDTYRLENVIHTLCLGTIVVLLLGLAACGGYDAPDAQNPGGSNPYGTGPIGTGWGGTEPGQNPEYVSANPNGGGSYGGGYNPDVGYGPGGYDSGSYVDVGTAPTEDTGSGPSSPGSSPEVSRGDIFRVLGDGLILNLNVYRGLQVIDINDVSQPRVIGRLELAGTPVELHLFGERAYILSNATGIYESERYGMGSGGGDGALIHEVDLSNPEKLGLISQFELEGNINTSRMVTDEDEGALYVVTTVWGYYYGGYGYDWGYEGYSDETVISSFDISGDEMQFVTDLVLAGSYATIQATAEVMMVAGYAPEWDSETVVTLIDIANTDGEMVQRGTAQVEGYVSNLFNLDFYQNMLRVVSSGWDVNHVYTFDATDLDTIVELDHATFGENEDLYATLFLGHKAFFVTFERVDPFHAFEITDQGEIIERSEFIVSGWNDYFLPVFGGDRLIGIGVDTDGFGNTMAVSLYDSSDLSNPEPLIERANVEADSSWSEGSWDDRAFSVLENVVEVDSPDGTLETGLILLPFNGTDYRYTGEQQSAVQIYTFSQNTLTRRGVMNQDGSHVHRSFLADEDVTANLSNNKMTLFDHHDPDEPIQLGDVELAPNFIDVHVFGSYVARIKAAFEGSYYWGSTQPSTLEVVSLEDSVDLAPAEAAVEIEASAETVQLGNLLIALTPTYNATPVTEIVVVDMSDPAEPEELAVVEADCGFDESCWSCSCPEWSEAMVTGNAVVGTARTFHEELTHNVEECWIYPTQDEWSCMDERDCTWYEGSLYCISEDGGEPECEGEVFRCRTYNCGDGYCTECNPVEDMSTVPQTTSCYDYPQYEYWNSYRFQIVDLSEPEDPQTSWIEMESGEEAVHVTNVGDHLVYTFSEPVTIEGDPHVYLAYYMRDIDLTDPSNPIVADPINIPGFVVGADGDRLITQDYAFDDEGYVETTVAQIRIEDGRAVLDARHSFGGGQVHTTTLDDRGHLLVSHTPDLDTCTWGSCYLETLSVLDTRSGNLDRLSLLEIDDSVQFLQAHGSHAFYQISGGVLVVNLQDASNPYPQAFHRISNWSWYLARMAVTDEDLLIPAGNSGLYRFSLDEENLPR